ncbi:MAG: GGDEF domain-containing protein, partial [Gammaproteobacteria bacterium]|nr:GGDEF domain-containing protein [Gammaproteobacteria bacterium]
CKPAGLVVTASIGVARLSEKHHEDFDLLYKDADHAVYESKEAGRNRVTFFDDKTIASAV